MNQPAFDLFSYPSSPGWKRTDTSRAAAESIASSKATLQRKALAAIRDAGARGLTSEELARTLRVDFKAIQPRTSELRLEGKIRDSGQRRLNVSGKRAIAWVAGT